jgi:hypothetical protein
MTPENDQSTNENKPKTAPAESAMSILERRLAEIEARKNAGATPPPPATPAVTPPAASSPAPVAVQPEKNVVPGHSDASHTDPSIAPEAGFPVTEPTPAATPVVPAPTEAPNAGGAVTTPELTDTTTSPEPIILTEQRAAEASSPETKPSEKPSNGISATEPNQAETAPAEKTVQPTGFLESSQELIKETIATHEAIPPVEPETTTLQPENAAAGTAPETETTPEKETPYQPENQSVISGEKASQPEISTGEEERIGTFSGQAPTGSAPVTEAERDAALGDENSVGNVISGAIAAHEIIPEIMPSQRMAEETGSGDTYAGTGTQPESAAQFEVEPEEETYLETDYSTLSASDLEKQISTLLKTENRKNHKQVMALYRAYEVKMAAEKNEALNKFVAEGGTADDFEYRVSPERSALEKGMQQLRESRVRDQRQEEEQKQKNLVRKQELIGQLRDLVESAETKNSGDRLKAIQEEWKATGPVPQTEAKELWNSYHALLDKFYNNRSIYFELKELDRKRNLNAKQQLIERAEALQNNESINASLQELRHLHEEWKNLGPVPNEQRDSIWERFIQASEKVHDRKKEFMAGRREVELQNLDRKTELLKRLEQFHEYNTDRINDWRDKTDEIQKVKEEWDAIGLVPKENADTVNKQFWGVYKAFFHHKNQFFKALDEQKMQNLKLKTELCEQAEELKNSTDWDDTKEKLIQLQKKWKTIGRVPDKYSDKIWERFRAACNEFFDRRQAEADNKTAEIEKLSTEKTAYLDELSEHLSHHQSGTLEELYQMVDKWKSYDAGNQRLNLRAEEKFYALMEKYLDTVPELSYDQKNSILFKLQLNKLKGAPDASSKLHQKEQSIRKEITQLENDIRTLKTNIEFFAKSKNAEKLREEYQVRTDEAHKRIALLQQQLKEMRG